MDHLSREDPTILLDDAMKTVIRAGPRMRQRYRFGIGVDASGYRPDRQEMNSLHGKEARRGGREENTSCPAVVQSSCVRSRSQPCMMRRRGTAAVEEGAFMGLGWLLPVRTAQRKADGA